MERGAKRLAVRHSLKTITSVMADQARLETIKDHPIGKGLDNFRASFNSVCDNLNVPSTTDALCKLSYDGNASLNC